jgi:hypothetical protein
MPLVLRFQWGLVPARFASVPAPLAWLRSPGGDLSPPFESSAPDGEGEWNAGAPEPGLVYAFDDDPRLADLRCPRCRAHFERVAAQIEGDVLQGAVAFLPGELARKVPAKPSGYAAVVVAADGSWQPRPDWEAIEADAPVLEDV